MRQRATWASGETNPRAGTHAAPPAPLLRSCELDQLPCIALVECNGQVVARNQLCRELTGDGPSGPVSIQSLLLGAFPRANVAAFKGRQRFDCLMVRQSGRPMVVSGAARPIFYGDRPARLILLMERAEGSAYADTDQAPFMEGLLNSVADAVAITYADRIFHINSVFTELFGYSADQAIGRNLNDLIVPESCRAEIEGLQAMVQTEGRAAIETLRRTRTGEEIDVALLVTPLTLAGGVTGRFVTFRDIRPQKLAFAHLHHTAMHDELTGLANRALFLDRLRLMMARRERRPDRIFSVMFLDLDHFKQVNDTLGHAAGDALLREVAQRLRDALRPEDTIARFGGDEFALLLGDHTSPQDTSIIASRIQARLSLPVAIGDQEAFISASIGIAVGGPQYQRPEEILRDADLAMYRAKAAGKKRSEFFDAAQPLEWPVPALDDGELPRSLLRRVPQRPPD